MCSDVSSLAAYQMIRKLARGMTDVYLVFDTGASRYAVLKIVEESPRRLTQLILEAERRGAELQKQLHEADSRVIEIYEYGEKDGYFFIAMQYIEGRTVAEILKEEKRIEPARAAKFAVEILSQLGSCIRSRRRSTGNAAPWSMATSNPPISRSAATMKFGCWISESPRR